MPRSRAQIEGLFDGLDLLPPGVADISHWPEPDPGGAALHFYGGVGVKPAGLPVTQLRGGGRRRLGGLDYAQAHQRAAIRPR
jgi:hypothetical protein